MARASLSNDEMWTQTEPLLPHQAPRRGGRWSEHRPVAEAICWRFRTGPPRRDLPADFPAWQRVWWWRFDRWAKDGTLDRVLGELQGQAHAVADLEWVVSVDSTVARTHQHAAGARKSHTGGAVDRRIVGFTGRRPPHINDARPKYLNSPSGPVYDKSRYLYRFSEQQTMMQNGARPLLVEGPLDVLAVTALGLEVAPISTCGTALSLRQATQLQPLLRNGGFLACDGDEADAPAALNAYERLSTYTGEIRGVQLPPARTRFPRGRRTPHPGTPHPEGTAAGPTLHTDDRGTLPQQGRQRRNPRQRPARGHPPVRPPTPDRCRRPRRIAQ
jgi:transposase